MDSEDIDEPDGVGGAAAVEDSEAAAAGPDDHEGDVVQSPEEEEEMATLDAQRIFLLMRKEYRSVETRPFSSNYDMSSLVRLSRNTRAHWYFSHLNSEIRVSNKQSMAEFHRWAIIIVTINNDDNVMITAATTWTSYQWSRASQCPGSGTGTRDISTPTRSLALSLSL